MVEVTRLELAASASRTQRSTKLSHTSKYSKRQPDYYTEFCGICQPLFLKNFIYSIKGVLPTRLTNICPALYNKSAEV